MPSSPSFAPHQRQPIRFLYRGISMLPFDLQREGKVPFVQNVRSWEEGTVTVRNGLTRRSAASLGSAVHSLFRLNDPAILAPGGVAERRLAGAGANLSSGIPAGDATDNTDGYAQIDTGYSGEPMSAVTAAPVNSPQPWIYVSDFDRMRKVSSANVVRSIGLPAPVAAPAAALDANQTTFLQSIDSGTWVAYGGEAGATSVTTRLSTVVNAIIYDAGATGMASVNLADMTGVAQGATIDVGGSPETVIVQELIPATSPTTIAAILYDVGASGLCTIQPTAGFAMGQLEIPLPEEVRRRYADLNEPAPPRVTITRTVDFPVNGLVMLNGIELVRILSVAIGTDGVMSFRAFTAGTYAATNTIVGIAAFRAYFHTTKSGGDPAVAPAAENTITPTDAEVAVLGGIQTAIGPNRDWSQTGNRAMQPDDIITLGIQISDLAHVQFVRLLLATNSGAVAAGDEFVENFYQYEWRANDLLEAVQLIGGAAPGPTQTMADAQAGAVAQGQIDSFYQDQFGQEPGTGAVLDHPDMAGQTGTEMVRYRAEGAPASDRTDGFVSVGATPSRQLALGNNQWITLYCRVRDLTRIGTDPGQTLGNLNSAAVVLQVLGTTDPVTVRYSDAYLTGGYGPDVGTTNPPYVWRYRYRSTITGERGNPSPSMRAGLPARRQRVNLSMTGCTEPQCDVLDIFRFGGALARWAYVRTVANNVGGGAVVANDDMADRQIDGGEGLRTDLYQPWPISDLPRQGTCTVAGTSVQWVSGDAFDPDWAPDTVVIINGRATSLYGSPSSTTRLQVIDNCDAGVGVPFSFPAPTKLAEPLPMLWGGPVDGVWFHFACGDPNDPGAVHWTHGNDPDAASDANVLVVTAASEPLQNGCVNDGVSFVFSTDNLYRLPATFGQANTFAAVPTACTRGLWNRWAMCVGDEGIYFVAKDGIFLTAWGSPEVSIVDPDLRLLFPRDGSSATDPGRCLDPIDMDAPMKLTRVDQMIYFDYYSTTGAGRTLVYEPLYQRWTPDAYVSAVESRIWEDGRSVHTNVIGCANGHVYQGDARKLTDDGTAVSWLLSTPWGNGGDLRALKQWGDVVLDLEPGGSFDGLRVEPVVDNGLTALLATTGVGQNRFGRQTIVVEVGVDAAGAGDGVLSQNFGLLLSGVTQTNDRARPLLYFWEPSWVAKAEIIARRATDWEDLGYKGAKFVQGVVVRANTFGVAKSVEVQADGAAGAVLTLSLTHSGEQTKTYPLAAAGWTPFVAELVRLQGADALDWVLLDWRFVWEPAPELATQWETQDTTFDFPGFGSVADAVLAYQSTAATNLRVWHDQSFVDYQIPSSAGGYIRTYHRFQAKKGKSFKFRWTGDAPFRVFQRDTSVRAQPWGQADGFRTLQPFGGPHRIAGAEV